MPGLDKTDSFVETMGMSTGEIELRNGAKVFAFSATSNLWLRFVFRRLNKVFEKSDVIRIDDRSRIVFFSDCHRGDNGRSDAFRHNKVITFHALGHYFREGFTYVEVGDGDDLWQVPRFEEIERAHSCIFERLRDFQKSGRLHMILGNHEIKPGQTHFVRKGNMAASEGLVLEHVEAGRSIFVVHGHQADFFSGFMIPVSRLAVRHIVRKLHAAGVVKHRKEISSIMNSPVAKYAASKLEKPLVEWARTYRSILICGHTHRAAYPRPGSPPYFNAGSCVYPGFITAIELVDGRLQLVKWMQKEKDMLRLPMSNPIPISMLVD